MGKKPDDETLWGRMQQGACSRVVMRSWVVHGWDQRLVVRSVAVILK